jgi:hypothetical protein
MKGSQESLTTVVVKDAANWLTPQEDDSSNVNPKDTRRAGLVSQVNGQANWPTPDASNHRDGEVLRKDNNLEQGGFHGVSLHHAMTKYGQAAPASSSSLGSRQGLSWPTPQTMDTLPVRPVEEFAETNKTRGGRKNRKALSNLREAVHSPVYQASWRTPQANEAGAKVETLFTKDGAPAMPGQRAYRLTPSGKLVLQSQTINQQVEMVENWATPQAHDAQGPKTPEQIAAMRAKGHGVKNLNEMVSWATPIMGDSHLASTPEVAQKRIEEGKVTLSRQNPGKLNPRWVETLQGVCMGWTSPSCPASVIKNWPKFVSGWCALTIEQTNCDSSATESSQPQPSELFAF